MIMSLEERNEFLHVKSTNSNSKRISSKDNSIW